eukprot:8114657-Pyramimonas_sp.AAC.1
MTTTTTTTSTQLQGMFIIAFQKTEGQEHRGKSTSVVFFTFPLRKVMGRLMRPELSTDQRSRAVQRETRGEIGEG